MCHLGVSIMYQNTDVLLPISELDEAIEQMMYKAGTEWVCHQCGRSAVRRIDIGRKQLITNRQGLGILHKENSFMADLSS